MQLNRIGISLFILTIALIYTQFGKVEILQTLRRYSNFSYPKIFSGWMEQRESTTIETKSNQQPIHKRNTEMPTNSQRKSLPVFFFSHGGPSFMYENDDFGSKGAWNTLKSLGKSIKESLKPDFIIVVSAHWSATGSRLIEISIPQDTKILGTADKRLDLTDNELIYDFYGFPDHMYQEQFHSKSSVELSTSIRDELLKGGLDAKLTKRGIDHGVWVPFKVAFSTNKKPEEKWDVDVPLVQVSLAGGDDFDLHFKLGEILSKFRTQNGLIICSGMSVHNLRDLGRSFLFPNQTAPYVKPFNSLLTDKLVGEKTKKERFHKIYELQKVPEERKLLNSAHPTLEHFMPIVVASGAINDSEQVTELYNEAIYSVGWGVYQFGEFPKANF